MSKAKETAAPQAAPQAAPAAPEVFTAESTGIDYDTLYRQAARLEQALKSANNKLQAIANTLSI